MDLYPIDDECGLNALVGLLQHAILFVFYGKGGLQFLFLVADVSVLFGEMGDEEFQGGDLGGGDGFDGGQGFVFRVVAREFLLEFQSGFGLLLPFLRRCDCSHTH